MAVKCARCHSADTQAEINTWFCFNCGYRTPMRDVPVPMSTPTEEPAE